MRRYTRLETAPVPVNPAMLNPPSQLLTAVDLDARVDWYATYLIITKEVTLINQDPVLNSATARLAQSMRETEDQLIRDMLEATASIINCTGGTNGDNPTEMVRSDIDGVVATLQNANGEFISEMIGGEDKFGTGPVRDCYFGLSSTNMIGQFENVAGFINKAQYPNDKGVNASEWCSIGNIRFFLSSRGSLTQNASLLGADIYNNFIVAQESYGTVDLTGSSVNFIYHPAGWGDDPRTSLNIKDIYTTGVFKSSLIDLEVAA
jgi:N4-gp56 family major capsid protein